MRLFRPAQDFEERPFLSHCGYRQGEEYIHLLNLSTEGLVCERQ